MDEDLNDQLPDEIAGALRTLDRDGQARAAGVDAGRVASRVLARLRDEPATRLRAPRWNLLVLRIAAVLALLVLGGAVAKRLVFTPGAAVSSLPVILPSGDSVTQADETALLGAVDDAHAAAFGGVLPATTVLVEDLNEQELETLLHTMDASEGSL